MARACHCPGTGDTLRHIHAQSPCDTAGGYPGVGSPLRSEAVGKGKALSHSGWILLLCSFWSNFPTAVGLPLRWPPATRFPHPPQAGRLLSCYGDKAPLFSPPRRRPWRQRGASPSASGGSTGHASPRRRSAAHAEPPRAAAEGAAPRARSSSAPCWPPPAPPAAASLRRGRDAAPPRLPPSCHFVAGAGAGRFI